MRTKDKMMPTIIPINGVISKSSSSAVKKYHGEIIILWTMRNLFNDIISLPLVAV